MIKVLLTFCLIISTLSYDAGIAHKLAVASSICYENAKTISVQVTQNPEWLELLDAPTSAPAWPTPLHSVLSGPNRFNPEPLPVAPSEQVQYFALYKNKIMTWRGRKWRF